MQGNAKFFTHKDALRQEIPLSAPPTDEQIARTRMVIAANSENAEECIMFLDMLGIPLPERVTA